MGVVAYTKGEIVELPHLFDVMSSTQIFSSLRIGSR